MSRDNLTEEEAELILAEQINALAEHARIGGPAPDCVSRIEKIIAENDAECLKMEREAEADEAEERAHCLAAGA